MQGTPKACLPGQTFVLHVGGSRACMFCAGKPRAAPGYVVRMHAPPLPRVQAGHALAAAAEGLPVGSVGLVLTLFLPSAYVLLDEADLARLGRWRVLRVACAGAWHNTMLSALCWAGAAGLAAAWRAGAAALQPPPAPLLVLHRLLGYTGSVSAALGLLNMAPVHFLDGEKALCALLGGDDAGGALPQAQRPQPAGGPRALRRLTPYVRRLAARWLLHAGTALLVTVAVLHVACLQWCAH